MNPQNVDGVHKTLQGADLTVRGFGNNLRVNNASVVCGGVQTANATRSRSAATSSTGQTTQ